MTTTTENQRSDVLPVLYALIWRAAGTDDEFNQQEFNSRIPRLMDWLRSLYAQGKLAAALHHTLAGLHWFMPIPTKKLWSLPRRAP